MELFFKDVASNILVTWDRLITELNEVISYNPYCKSKNYYDVFKHLIVSLMYGKEIILLDSDFTEEELIKLTGHKNFDEFSESIFADNKALPTDKRSLVEKLRKTGKDWKVTIFTSGTTGIPKNVSHNFESISRFVKYSENNIDSKWGFAYNPTHMAGIQVFFQALLNGNSIIRLYGLSPKNIYSEIKKNQITHISATPTFYRLIIPYDDSFPSVIRITSGGEKFDVITNKKLGIIFPNAKITNVYASTEAGTLFASDNDVFSIKFEYTNLIKVINNEIVIHRSLIGATDICIDEWYYTGDLIEIITEKPFKFRFISRKSDMINVGGYKVNPIEIEEVIRGIVGIKDVIVYSKSNSVLGNIVCCDIVCNNKHLVESTIRAYLQSKVQEFKIPRIINFVEELSITRTGKIKRNQI